MVTTEIFQVSSQFQILALAAAIRSGAVSSSDAQRVLLVCNNALIPENAEPLLESAVAQYARGLFASVVDFNDLMYPLKPVDFSPHPAQAALVQKLLRGYLGIARGDRVDLFVESLQSSPASGLAAVFWESRITVHADGLMVFGPSRKALPRSISDRITDLSFPDFVEELRPLLLSELNVTFRPTSASDFRREVALFVNWARSSQADSSQASSSQASSSQADSSQEAFLSLNPSGRERYVLVLGQYLSSLGVYSAEQDHELAMDMVRRAQQLDCGTVVFKPHPSASKASSRRLVEEARALGISLVVESSTVPVEVFFEAMPPQAVVSAFSTGLATAHFVYGIPAFSVGTAQILEALTPFQNSNRIPATLCDLLFSQPRGQDVVLVTRAVAYCMQPNLLPLLRPHAEQLIAESDNGLPELSPVWRRYIKRRRAESLDLIALPQKIRLDSASATQEGRSLPGPTSGVRRLLKGLRIGAVRFFGPRVAHRKLRSAEHGAD